MNPCLLYTSDAADEEDSVDLGGRRIIKKKLINAEEFYNRINNGQKRDDPGNEDLFLLIAIVTYSKGVFLSVNPKTDFRSKNEFRVPFGKSKSGFLIW